MPTSSGTTNGRKPIVLQPFYILSIVVGAIIAGSLLVLSIRGCRRRRTFRQRFTRAIDNGWATAQFQADDQQDEEEERNKKIQQTKPEMHEKPLNVKSHIGDDGKWQDVMPLSMTALPTPTNQQEAMLLHLLTTPAFFTSKISSRARLMKYLRSKKRRDLVLEQETRSSLPSNALSSQAPLPTQLTVLIAMPSAKPASRSSPATAHETVLEVAEQELCLGAVDVLWRAPIRTADSEKQNEDEIEEEDEDYAASTIRTRLQGHGPGPSRSFISSRHINSYDYGEGASSYLPRGSESHSRATSNFDHQASNVDPNHLHQYSYTTPSISVSRLSHNPSHLSVPDFPPESLSHGAQEDVRLEPSLQPPPTGQEYLDVARSSRVTNDTLSQVGTTDGEAGYEGDLEHRNTLRPKTRGHTTTYV